MILDLPAASTWETQCFASAVIFGVTVIGVLAPSIARRRTASRRVAVGLTVLIALVFVGLLALIFATIDPCAQGPA